MDVSGIDPDPAEIADAVEMATGIVTAEGTNGEEEERAAVGSHGEFAWMDCHTDRSPPRFDESNKDEVADPVDRVGTTIDGAIEDADTEAVVTDDDEPPPSPPIPIVIPLAVVARVG